MHASPAGSGIVLKIDDSHARYPLLVDPVIGQTQEINDPGTTTGDEFGYSVAISGSNAVVGAIDADRNHGAIYIFSNTSGAWNQVAAINDPAGGSGDDFGASVAIAGNVVVAGDPQQMVGSNATQGAAYVYAKNVDGIWAPLQTLSDANGKSGDLFGTSVATDGTTLAIGAPDATTSVPFEGTVYASTSSIDNPLPSSQQRSCRPPTRRRSIEMENDGRGRQRQRDDRRRSPEQLHADPDRLHLHRLRRGLGTGAGRHGARPRRRAFPAADRRGRSEQGLCRRSVRQQRERRTCTCIGPPGISQRRPAGAAARRRRLIKPADGGGEFGRSLAVDAGTMIVGAFGQNGNTGAAYVFNGARRRHPGSGSPKDLRGLRRRAERRLRLGSRRVGRHDVRRRVRACRRRRGLRRGAAGPDRTHLHGHREQRCRRRHVLRRRLHAARRDQRGQRPRERLYARPDRLRRQRRGRAGQIEIDSPLPAITDSVVIDATTQPGYNGTAPLVILDGADCDVSTCDGLDVRSFNTTIRGLSVTGFNERRHRPGRRRQQHDPAGLDRLGGRGSRKRPRRQRQRRPVPHQRQLRQPDRRQLRR